MRSCAAGMLGCSAAASCVGDAHCCRMAGQGGVVVAARSRCCLCCFRCPFSPSFAAPGASRSLAVTAPSSATKVFV